VKHCNPRSRTDPLTYSNCTEYRQFVVEQLFGTPRENFVDGLNWTPLEAFKARDHAGWHAMVPCFCFRHIDQNIVNEAIDFLNRIVGRPFFGEDCTSLIERAFGKRRLFADSPTASLIGLGIRVGDPALMLLRTDARLDSETEKLIRADVLRALPDPKANWDDPTGTSGLGAAFLCCWVSVSYSPCVECVSAGAVSKISVSSNLA
jgi:hypothetical protein